MGGGGLIFQKTPNGADQSQGRIRNRLEEILKIRLRDKHAKMFPRIGEVSGIQVTVFQDRA